jgi:hypothetical protein
MRLTEQGLRVFLIWGGLNGLEAQDLYYRTYCFAECNTRQKSIGELYIGNDFFAEYFLSVTRQRLCRASLSSRQENLSSRCQVMVMEPLPRAVVTLGKGSLFAECLLYRHLAKKLHVAPLPVPLPSV